VSIPLQYRTTVRPPFEAIADVYDDTFSNSAIGRSQRRSVWREMDRAFHSGDTVLELNCGTGVDALHMAERSIRVDACDSSPAMIAHAARRAASGANRPGRVAIRCQCLAIERLDLLAPAKPYDGVLSNFSGLNCVEDLKPVVRSLSRLVRPGGKAVVCLFGTRCLWETLWYLRTGNVHKAFRRFRRRAVKATIGPDATVMVHYRTVSSVRRTFAPYFQLKRSRGVGVTLPPSYAGEIPAKFPRLFRVAVALDPVFGRCPIVWSLADHVILTFERSETAP
jgi:ubiquinone/menaquinone biosynthesis C-methylase UbiE